MGTSPAIHLWTVRYRNDVATTLQLEFFKPRNTVDDFFRQKLNFTGKKTAKSRFVAPFGGLRVWLVGKLVVDFLLVLIELFSPTHG